MAVLFVLSSHDQLGTTGRKTGTWLEELLAPYYVFVDRGIGTAFVSPRGGDAPLDPASIDALSGQPLFDRYMKDEKLRDNLRRTGRLSAARAEDYEAAIYPGGHGPLFDLRKDVHSQVLIRSMLENKKPVGVICHAGCVLIDIDVGPHTAFVQGRDVTAFSDSEEAAVGLTDCVPYSVESELRSKGARYSAAPNWTANVRADRGLITGQNPASAAGVAAEIVKALGK